MSPCHQQTENSKKESGGNEFTLTALSFGNYSKSVTSSPPNHPTLIQVATMPRSLVVKGESGSVVGGLYSKANIPGASCAAFSSSIM